MKKINCSAFFSVSLPLSNFLNGDQYIPERIRNKLNKKTSFIMENGLQRFYESYGEYLEKSREIFSTHKGNDEHDDYEYYDEDDGFQALTMDNLRGPMILVLCLFAFSGVILLVEIIMFKLKERRILRNFVYYP